MTRHRVVVAGNLSLDDTITPDASYPSAPGGDALYASLAVRAWGGTPLLLTLVGDDYPLPYLERMRAAGIDMSHVRTAVGPTVHYRCTYEVDGARVFEWVGAEERLLLTSPAASDYDAVLPMADWLHIAAMPIEAQEVAVTGGRAAGVPMSLDPHEEYVVGFQDRLRALAEGVVFMPSELEARLLFPDLDIGDPVDFGTAAAERLDAWRPSMTTVKLGERGSVVRVGGRSSHIPARAATVVDPTGAGDAYCGGFVVGWLSTGDGEVGAACGSVAAAETIGRFGAFTDGLATTDDERLAQVADILRSVDGMTESRIAGVLATLGRHLIDAPEGAHP